MGSFGREEVPSRGLNKEDIALFEKSFSLLKRLEVPQLYDANNPNSRIFFALADGTENDLSDSSKYTNVAKLFKELEEEFKDHPHIGFDYIEGVGIQENKVVAKADAILSFSFKDRADELYETFSKQATTWRQENPNAEISVVQVGFSRGCGVAAYLNQKIHNEGILDTSHKITVNGQQEYSGEKLIEPGAVKQATVMIDPVLTNMKHQDFNLSNSTVSVLQINANDEKRTLFPVSYLIEEGLSTNKNSINITMPGCHSDIGGSYKEDGLGKVSRDIQNKYLNALTGKNHFKEIEIPTSMKEYAIHDSSKHNVIYRTQEPRGINNVINPNLDNSHNTIPINKIHSIQKFTEISKTKPVTEKKIDFEKTVKQSSLKDSNTLSLAGKVKANHNGIKRNQVLEQLNKQTINTKQAGKER